MSWTAPRGVLGRIVAEAEQRVAQIRDRAGAVAELERLAAAAPAVPSFSDALRGGEVAIIAEIKRRSPSKGEINATLDPVQQACDYAAGGAAAISVLTEPVHFGGSLDDLAAASRAGLPLLRKDFLVDEVQLLEARAALASAALLIVRALPPATLARLAAFAHDLGLEILVEARSEQELELALGTGTRMVGINNRDLESLAIDRTVGDRLIGLVPSTHVAVSESGVERRDDIERAARAGADAVLVGSSLSARCAGGAEATEAAASAGVRALAGVARCARGR